MKLLVALSPLLLLSGSAFAASILTAGDTVTAVQLQDGNTISVSTVGTTAGANNHPAGEAPGFAIDGLANTKYLNFGELNTGIVVQPTAYLADNGVTQTIISGLSLITGNDAPDRDPASFSIYGTNVPNSTTFADYFAIVTDQPILATDPGRGGDSGLATFSNTEAYNTYLVIFPTVRNAAGANSMQVAEIRLEGNAIPEPSTLMLCCLCGLGAGFVRRR